jgi:hypothetical protein
MCCKVQVEREARSLTISRHVLIHNARHDDVTTTQPFSPMMQFGHKPTIVDTGVKLMITCCMHVQGKSALTMK